MIDKDGSGEIDFNEFCNWAIKKSFKYFNIDEQDKGELGISPIISL